MVAAFSSTWLCSARAALLATIMLPSVSATAHEFWLEPVVFMPATGQSVPVVHRIGQNFVGDSFPYVRAWHKRYSLTDGRGERAVKGVEGDDPAVELKFRRPGLAILAYHSTPDELVFETMDRFADRHRRAGKPEKNIKEVYSRCAKTLIRVGSGTGNDRAVGLPLELVAEKSPYALGPDNVLPVRLLFNGRPLAGATIKVFQTDVPKTHRRLVTDSDGRARISLPTKDRYLLNAVHMHEPPPGAKPDWTSLWASLTFLRP